MMKHVTAVAAVCALFFASNARGFGDIVATVAGIAPPAVDVAATTAETRLVILHLNDTHGQLGRETDGATSASRIAEYVAETRAENPDGVLLLHAGDEFSRGDEMTRSTLGASSFAYFNRIGLDVFTPGNGDFYDGVSNLLALASTASFAVLHANSGRKDGGDWFPATTTLERSGIRIAIIGGGLIKDHESEGIAYTPFNTAVKTFLPGMTDNADLTIALTHQGVLSDFALAARSPELNLIIGGHSHTALATPVPATHADGATTNHTWVAQAGEYGRHIGRIDLVFKRDTDTARPVLSTVSGHLVPMTRNNSTQQ